MSNKGFSHIGLSTLDLDKTREFYETTLGFKVVRCDIIKIKEGGNIRHMFIEVGRDQLIAFMEPNNVDAIPVDYDTGINEGLGVPGPFYHFAFEAGSVPALEAKRLELISKGLTVTDVVDHEWAKSIYLKDPNGISLEFCCLTRDVGNEDDVTMQERAELSIEKWLGDNYINMRISSRVEEPALADD
ncbi:MAG: VOC family protein [SAR202 cluster bacterium]|jgi:catechol 2,3-dioxygenase-like lactoylglutathione lyase family enzyme|nr:VOC family protein [Dehalococcoidia bacterium]MQF88365.1 VOC family protein [SAR202 cluster bacterium]|tara:strand:- start:1679 stop:2239 length:561 start_codon:yes stop_codon:yes gene_type:complete